MTKARAANRGGNFYDRFFQANDPHRTLVDQISSSEYIVGKALPQFSKGDFAWQIFRVEFIGTEQQVTFAGDGEHRFRWYDRELVLDDDLPEDGSPGGIFLTNYLVDAGSPAGTKVGELFPKALAVGTLSYAFEIVSDPSNKFELSPANNCLRLTDTALGVDDFYLVDIKVIDELGRSFTETLTIDVVTIRITSDEVDEDASLGTKIADIVAVEGVAPITFSLISDPDNKFDISGSDLITDGVLDFEVAEEHQITIQSTDALLATRTENFTIKVIADANSIFTSVITEDSNGDDAVRVVLSDLPIPVILSGAKAATDFFIAVPAKDTKTSHTFQANTKAFTFGASIAKNSFIRYNWDETAFDAGNKKLLDEGETYCKDNIDLVGKTIYFETSEDNVNIEIEEWT